MTVGFETSIGGNVVLAFNLSGETKVKRSAAVSLLTRTYASPIGPIFPVGSLGASGRVQGSDGAGEQGSWAGNDSENSSKQANLSRRPSGLQAGFTAEIVELNSC